MVLKSWAKIALIAVASVAAVGIGFAVFRSPIQQQIVKQSAMHAFGQGKLNILILGYQDDEETTDTIILAHLDVDRRTATLVWIPRDTWVTVPGQGSMKINAAYSVGGAKMTQQVVSTLLGGIPIDATIALQPEGAAQIVDAMGGLNVNVDENMDYDDNYGQLHIHLKKGEQYLTGSQVVGYVRFRNDAESDFGRVRRQQQVLKLIMDQLSEPQNWELQRIMKFARKDSTTTLSDQRAAGAALDLSQRTRRQRARLHASQQSRLGGGRIGRFCGSAMGQTDRNGALLQDRSAPGQRRRRQRHRRCRTRQDPHRSLARRRMERPTFIDQPTESTSTTVGASASARALSHIFATTLRPGTTTTLVIGSDLAPASD